MSNLLKIIVTDSSGVEHIFNEIAGEVENWLNLKDENGFVKITTRTFENSDKFDTEIETIFISPRRVDALYVPNVQGNRLADTGDSKHD